MLIQEQKGELVDMTWDYYGIEKEDFNIKNEKRGIEILLTKAVNIGLRNREEILKEVNEYGGFEFTKEDVTRAAEIIAKAISDYIYKR